MFVTAAFVKEVFSSAVAMIVYTFLSMMSLLIVCLFPTPMIVTGFAFIIGFAAAGGVLQIGATIMAMSFPNGKGKATGIFYTAGSLASFTIPLITAKLSKMGIASIMWFDLLIAIVGFAIALYIGYRQLQVRAAAKHPGCSNRLMVNDKRIMDTNMTQAVTVKNITFQEGETLICVPLIGKTLAELQTNARALATAGADIIEWRVDHFTQVRETEQVLLALGEIRQLLKEIPLLFTFRSKKRGWRNGNQRRSLFLAESPGGR